MAALLFLTLYNHSKGTPAVIDDYYTTAEDML
jgi:hypothetical protein